MPSTVDGLFERNGFARRDLGGAVVPAVRRGRRVLVIEIGAGWSTPAVVRRLVEQVVRALPGARLVRISRDRAEVPGDLTGRTLAIRADVTEVLARTPGPRTRSTPNP
ncbi:hypothetical protein [Lentzea sp. NPDC059081]|uniref:hypothetical protein n=1 Tax=Lentzea sp. NPDC059081 TaxID=3346719 RepID=UPI0036CB93F1